jgi:hypothetical protein
VLVATVLAAFFLLLIEREVGVSLSFLLFFGVATLQILDNVFQKRCGPIGAFAFDVVFGCTLGLPIAAFAIANRTCSLAIGALAICEALDWTTTNVIVGNLKDLYWDNLVGDHTTAIALGVKALSQDGAEVELSRQYQLVTVGLLLIRGTFMVVALSLLRAGPALMILCLSLALTGLGLWARAAFQHPFRPYARFSYLFVALNMITVLLLTIECGRSLECLITVLVLAVTAPMVAALLASIRTKYLPSAAAGN